MLDEAKDHDTIYTYPDENLKRNILICPNRMNSFLVEDYIIEIINHNN